MRLANVLPALLQSSQQYHSALQHIVTSYVSRTGRVPSAIGRVNAIDANDAINAISAIVAVAAALVEVIRGFRIDRMEPQGAS